MSENWHELDDEKRNIGREILADCIHALMFLTRLPVKLPEGMTLPPLAQSARAFGVVGLLIGALSGLLGWIGFGLGLPSLAAAGLAVGFAIMLGGAMQEDGFADVADGFWGGHERARKLEIMRDSRIGAYGVLALVLLLVLRISLAQALLMQGGPWLVLGLAGAGALGRGLMARLMAQLPPARTDGLSASSGQPSAKIARQSLIFAVIVAGICFVISGGLLGAALGLALGFGAAEAISRLSRKHIGGQTGDVCGALSASVELASLAGLVMALS